MKILHAPLNIAGQAYGLSSKERILLGDDDESLCLDIQPSNKAYPADIILNLNNRGFWGKRIRLAGLIPQVLIHNDVLHYYFGWSFFQWPGKYQLMNLLDLFVFRMAGKKIFMTFQGCDARLRKTCAINICPKDICNEKTDKYKRSMIRRVSKLCHKVFCLNPDLIPIVPGSEFLPYLSVDPGKIQFKEIPSGKKIKIVHAPTDRGIKGTDIILKVIEGLKKDYEFDFVLVENLNNEEALKIYRDADLAIDQILSGWYGAFAVEVMAMGIPVIACIKKDNLRYLPEGMANDIPVISADSESLKRVLEDILKNPESLKVVGKRSRDYAVKWHNPIKIAEKVLEIYKDSKRKLWGE